MNDSWKLDRIGTAVRGENPTVLARMKSGYAVIGDTQFLPGYCVLLAEPQVPDLNSLDFEQRKDFLFDMSLLGDAIQAVCEPRRLNYSIYGNTDSFLHAHLFPRYEWEPEAYKPYPVWKYPMENWQDPQYQYFSEEQYLELRQKIAAKLQELIRQAY